MTEYRLDTLPIDPFGFVSDIDGKPFAQWLLHPSLHRRSEYLSCDHYRIYFRKQLLGDHKKITVANISSNDEDRDDFEYDPHHKSTGNLRVLISYLKTIANLLGDINVEFELVHNEWLAQKLKDYGFHETSPLILTLKSNEVLTFDVEHNASVNISPKV
jgi:hypothetical protein